ncbi:MAG: TRAP transporter small permease [Woeseiaceae bacterium]|nr:TRAP transporter small permease [Woeseiaceae bacterium]
MFHFLIPVFERLDRAGRFIETFLLVTLFSAMMLLAVGQIVLREVFSTGFVWADELIKLMVLWLAMVGAVAAARDNRHIRIDAFTHIFPRMAVQLTRVAVDVFAALVSAVVAWHAWRYLQVEIEYADTVLVNVPAWVAHSVLPAAFLLISFRFLVLASKQVVAIIVGLPAERDE